MIVRMKRKTRIISFINQKGGCGKTTCCASVASGLNVFYQKKVLLIDLDVQRNLSAYYGVYDLPENKKSVYHLLKTKESINPEDYIISSNGVDIIASSHALVNFDIEFGNKIGRENLLKKRITPWCHQWDYICIDTPPSLSLITLQALTTSTELFIVTQPKYFDLLGMTELLTTVHEVVENEVNSLLKITGIIINMYDSRMKHHKEIIQMIQENENLKDKLFKNHIRHNIALSEASSWGHPIFSYAPSSNGASDFRKLCREIIAMES